MSTVTQALLQDHEGDVASSEVIEINSAMAIDDAGVTLRQQAQRNNQVCSIPFEFVDDDELTAIENAMLQAHSVSSSFHTIASVLPSPHPSHDSSSKTQFLAADKAESSFVYTVVSTSGSTLASSEKLRAQHGSVFTTIASARSCRARQGSPTSGFEDVCSSQSPVDMCTPSQLEDGEEVLSDNLVSTTNLSFFREGSVEAQIPGDSQDIEDFCGPNVRVSLDDGSSGSSTKQEAVRRTNVTLLQRKSGRGLSVTDFTASEWCEKQVEFSLNRGKPEQTPAMKAGVARHVQLEKEVVTSVEIEIFTKEDTWAVRLLNFISGARQLLSEGLTRELPVVGLVGATWVVGIIDEIRLVQTECGEQPLLVDTKTRRRRYPPSEPQKRNARLQLMCYKLLWDSMVTTGLPSDLFFRHFRLNPQQEFCKDVKCHAATFWVDSKVQCLRDLLAYIMKDVGSQIFSKSVTTLLLRYEWQEDHSLLGEDEFLYEHDWLMDRWMWHSDFWGGHRAASSVPEDEAWKCRYCSFASVCLPSQQSTGEDFKENVGEDAKENVKKDIKEDGKKDTNEDIKGGYLGKVPLIKSASSTVS